MGIDEPLTREIVRRILAAARPDRVILFGSAATGKMTRDSDIDILIVEPSPADHHEESVRIRRALGNVGFPVDVIVISTERFEETKNIFGGIAYPAHKYGRVLYEAACAGDSKARTSVVRQGQCGFRRRCSPHA